METRSFKAGDIVRFVPGSVIRKNHGDGPFTVALVLPLPNPCGLSYCAHDAVEYGDPYASGRTNLDLAGHPQRIFFDNVLEKGLNGLPIARFDSEGKGRACFSGAHFVLA